MRPGRFRRSRAWEDELTSGIDIDRHEVLQTLPLVISQSTDSGPAAASFVG
jgi:hypothetical protein